MVGKEFEKQHPDPSRDPLWHRIEAFDLDGLGGKISFSRRLAPDNAWTATYTKRVMEEYKRFCYLALNVEHEVAPSDQIDRAWVLHLGFSREYRDEFCAKVLQSELHHSPAPGPDREDAAAHCDTYSATMKSYQRLSGAPPPRDIWPSVERLFSDSVAMRQVNAADYMVIPRPPKGLLWAVQFALVLAPLYYLMQGDFPMTIGMGIAAVAMVVYRARTDNKWLAPRRDRDVAGW